VIRRFFPAILILVLIVTSSAIGADLARHGAVRRHVAGKTHGRRKGAKHHRLAKRHRQPKHHRRVKKKAPAKHPASKLVAVPPVVATPTLTLPPAAAPVSIPPVLAPAPPGGQPLPPSPPAAPPVTEQSPESPKSTGPLVGYSKLEDSTDTDSVGSVEAFEYTAVAAGTVNSLSLYVAAGNSATSILVGLYSSFAGHPGKLLTSATIESPITGAWNTVDVAPVAVSAGSVYWLAALAPSGTLALRDVESGGGATQESRPSLSTLPSSWSSGKTYANSPASFYASGETVAAPPPKEEPAPPPPKEEPTPPPPTEEPAPPPPQEPTASFTYTPASPVVGQPVEFNGASSTCPGGSGSCTYEWSNDGSPTRPIPPIFPLGSGRAITLTFSSAGTEYMRLVVTDELGQTATVEHDVTVATELPPPTGQQIHCFSAPGACGYPDPNYANVGPSTACSSLESSGSLTVTTAGAVIENKNITGDVTIDANNVTLTNDCITLNGQGSGDSSIVDIGNGDAGTQITHSDISGANSTTQSVEEALNNNYSNSSTSADYDYIYNCGECVHGAWTLTNSYVTSNANISGAHYEDIYCSDETFVAEHDVLINPHEQTANLFCNADGGGGGPADNHITLTNSLLAGAGYSLYPQGNSTSVGTSTMKIVGNRFARCTTATVVNNEGDATCSGGSDANGYWPNGGYYGIDAYTYCPPTAGQEWSNNVWDNNNESVGC
jgi:hypothetical protein